MANLTQTNPRPMSSGLPINSTACPITAQFPPSTEPLPVPANAAVCAVDVITGNVPVLEGCCNTTNITYAPLTPLGHDWCWAYCVYRIADNSSDFGQANHDMFACFQGAALARNMSQDALLGGLQCTWEGWQQNATSSSGRRMASGGWFAVLWVLSAGFVLATTVL